MRVGYVIDTTVARPGRTSLLPAGVGATMDAMVQEGRLAEQAGFHSVHVPDRHGTRATLFPGPEGLLTLLAHETQRVMLGSFTWVATLGHPMKAAESFAVIDQLSRGRLVTTVSRGFLPSFWDQFGVPQERMLGRLNEALEVWRLAFEGGRFDFDGEFWPVRGGRLAPPPFQDGGWPLWGGGNQVRAAIRRSARFADAWTCDPMPTTRQAFAADAGAYRERAAELGKVPFVVAMRDGWVADTDAEALAAFGGHYADMAGFYAGKDHASRHPEPVADLMDHMVAGTPERCLERLVHLREEWGIDYVVFCCRLSTGPSMEAAAEQILRFGEQVVRPLHARYPAPDHPAIPVACRW